MQKDYYQRTVILQHEVLRETFMQDLSKLGELSKIFLTI